MSHIPRHIVQPPSILRYTASQKSSRTIPPSTRSSTPSTGSPIFNTCISDYHLFLYVLPHVYALRYHDHVTTVSSCFVDWVSTIEYYQCDLECSKGCLWVSWSPTHGRSLRTVSHPSAFQPSMSYPRHEKVPRHKITSSGGVFAKKRSGEVGTHLKYLF